MPETKEKKWQNTQLPPIQEAHKSRRILKRRDLIDSASVALGASWRYDSRQGIASEKRFSR
jgi:hypothetical protein